MTLAFNNPVCPGNAGFNPTTPETINGANFTENLSGRDVGSTWIQFKTVSSPEVYIFKTYDLTPTVIAEFVFSLYFPQFQQGLIVTAQANFLILMGNWRVPASGTYTLLFPGLLPSTIFANETWTTTTIS